MYHVLKDNDMNLLIAVFLYFINFYHSLTIIDFYHRKHNSDDENTNPNSNRDSKVAKSTSTVMLATKDSAGQNNSVSFYVKLHNGIYSMYFNLC